MRKLNFWYQYVPSVFAKDLEKAFEIWAHQRCYTFVVGSGSAYKAKNSKLFKGLECLSENRQVEIFNFVSHLGLHHMYERIVDESELQGKFSYNSFVNSR